MRVSIWISNELRIAFSNWLQTCTRLLTDKVNLVIDVSKPINVCGVHKSPNGPVTVMIYVDDLLIGSIVTREIDNVRDALQEILKVKTTEMLTNANEAGRTIVFLSHHLIQRAGTSDC